MAKRKKQAEEKSGFQYTNELIGLLLILLSITGLGNFGLVGGVIKKFAIFLFGNWFFLFLVLTLCLGVVLIAKRGKINYLSNIFFNSLIKVFTSLNSRYTEAKRT